MNAALTIDNVKIMNAPYATFEINIISKYNHITASVTEANFLIL